MPDDLLSHAPRCVLALTGADGPLIAPMAFWFDGEGLWFSTSSGSVKAEALRRDDRCALYVPPSGDDAATDEGVVVDGRARVLGAHDPIGLALHAVPVAGAMAALAAKNALSVWGYVQDAARVPPGWLPRSRVAVRVAVDRLRRVRPPPLGPGIAPPLPTVVPPEVRRVLGGRRRVTLATEGTACPELGPAVLEAGYRLDVPAARTLLPGRPAALCVDADPRARPTEVVGLALSGTIEEGPMLRPDRVTWWHGFSMQSADVPVAHDPIVLPD